MLDIGILLFLIDFFRAVLGLQKTWEDSIPSHIPSPPLQFPPILTSYINAVHVLQMITNIDTLHSLQSIVYLRVHSHVAQFYEVWQMHTRMFPPLTVSDRIVSTP